MMTLYLIQGFFFQKQSWLDIGVGSDGEWPAVFIKRGLSRFMYSGVIYPDDRNILGVYAGQMFDHFGESLLSKVVIRPKEIKFIKKYDRRDDLIDYEFTKHNGMWVGGYSGPVVGQGGAKCIITEVPEGFLRPL